MPDRVVDEARRITTEPPETHYVLFGASHIAYQTLGEGPPLVLIADWFGHVDAMWEWPPYAHALRRLASFSRLIVFDKRGVGLSDQLPNVALPGLTEWMQDVTAVMDAVGAPKATLVGVGAGGAMCMSVAAAHPERVERLVLVNAYARLLRADDYRPGYPLHLRDRVLTMAYTADGPARVLRGAEDAAFLRWWRRFQRQSVSPNTATAMRQMMFDTDVRSALDKICAPTLVVHREDDEWIRLDHGEYLAAHIPEAQLAVLPGGEDLFFHGDADGLIDEIEAFVTDGSGDSARERSLATMLFTDLIDSTGIASEVGDLRWRVLLDDHDAIVDRHVSQSGGRLVKSTGDGMLGVFPTPSAALRCAMSMRSELASIGLATRMGVHVGEIEIRNDDIGGIAVNTTARVMALGDAGEILVSRTVRDIVIGSRFRFEHRGTHLLKGVTEPWEIYEAVT